MIAMTRRAMGASGLALLAGCASNATSTNAAATAAAAPAHPQAAIGAWGVDLNNRDMSVKPGDDFFKYANGTWLKNTQIPADRTRWGAFDMLRDKSDRDTRAIIVEVSQSGGAPGSAAQKVGDYYNAYLNQDAIDALALAPIQPELDRIKALQNHEQVIRLIGDPAVSTNAPIAIYISLDERNPDRYIPIMTHAGLGLPEREYYRRTDGQFPQIRQQYEAHVARMLGLVNQTDTAAKAHRIMALETAIAERHWVLADRRDRDKTYNLKTRAEVKALYPQFPWDAAFDSCGLGNQQEVVVSELSAMRPLAQLFMQTPVSTWREYLTWHLVRNNAPVLPRTIDDANFDFYGKTLNGQPQQRERWKRAVDNINGSLGEAVGQIYVQRHFPAEAKAQMLTLVENLRSGYADRIQNAAWMTPETKAKAIEKLRLFRPKIGYPDKWKDYSAMDIRAGDAYGNNKRAGVWSWNFDLARLGKPSDRDEWFMNPQTVNAYYNPTFNEIVFPAAILQPPFFDPNADLAVNYGAIGGVIGHEMGHGFDDQGAKSDGHGVLQAWWSPADVAAFNQIVQKLAAQYDSYSPLPGIHVNGPFTSGENMGDNGGLQVAHKAYQIALNGAAAPDIDGVTADQRFYLGWAQVWAALIRDEALRNQILTDPHSPSQYRCNGSVRNMDEWYAAFNVQPGDALYLAPGDRVHIW
ncbi:MAG TPA: M13 family metallopeptidase [Vitreimonas sp.]|jgi:putative endopeptidase|nr:M13 family metallopeptidase [Vitreimonas sp.]